jgi:aldose 1-epimerase
MVETIRLEAGSLSVVAIPSLGGGLARFDLARDRGVTEIFRPWPKEGGSDPNALGLYVLAPWSNRISGGGFSFGGVFRPLAPNVAGEPFPIHGDAWQAPWTVKSHDSRHARLIRDSAGPGPFRYHAHLDYALSADELLIRLTIANRAREALPYGAGFHPWLRRTPGTRLVAPALSVWLEDERHLPTTIAPVASREEWNFANARALPTGWINNGFIGWNGRATIVWEDRDVSLEVRAGPRINTYILYSPSAEAPFFCFEPVTHAVDAHNLAPGPEAHGLIALAPGSALVAECRFIVRAGLKEMSSL